MAKLSSAIVQRKIASLRDVEEALARQVLYGGDLVTNLLQQASGMDEDALTQLLAESLELRAAPGGELPRSSEATLQTIPGEVVSRHNLYPLAYDAGVLTVAVSERLKPDVEQDLCFALGAQLEQRAAALVRIRQAIARDYGLPLDRRSERVLAKIEGRPDPNPSLAPAALREAPALSALPRPPTIPPIGLPVTGALEVIERAHPDDPELSVAPLLQTNDSAASVHDAVTAKAPEVTPREAPPRSDATETPREAPPRSDATEETPREVPAIAAATPTTAADSPVAEAAAPVHGQVSLTPRQRATWTAEQRRKTRTRPRHRGPYTAAQAEEDLLRADDRDDVLRAFFDFAAQYFEYSALFAVHGDIAEGRDAQGPGADRVTVTGIGVPLDLPSALSRVRIDLKWKLSTLEPSGLDQRLADDLRRKTGNKVLLVPVAVQQRCVLIFYGDDGDNNIELSEVGDVIAFAPLVASALENIIRRRKAAARRDAAHSLAPDPNRSGAAAEPREGSRAPLPSTDERAEALARALGEAGRVRKRDVEDPAPRAAPAAPDEDAVESPVSEEDPGDPVAAPPPSSRSLRESAPPKPVRANEQEASQPAEPLRRVQTPAHGTPQHATPAPVSRSLGPRVPPSEPPEAGWDVPDAEPREAGRGAGPAGPEEVPEISIGVEEMGVDWSGESSADEGLPDQRTQSVSPQTPVKGYSSEELKLPKVIVNVASDCSRLVEQLLEGDQTVIDELVSLGNAAVTALMANFPGPTRDPDAIGNMGSASRSGPLLAALAAVGVRALPFIVVRTNDANPTIRFWATWLLGDIPGPESAEAIVRRLSDSDHRVRRAAREAGRLAQSDASTRTRLRERATALATDSSQPSAVRLAALEGLAHWRDPRSVSQVISLTTELTEVGKSAGWALRQITRQDFGADVQAWHTWLDENADRHRIEWLIDALMHGDQQLRREAGDELKSLTKEFFGYYDDLPQRERQQAQKRYRTWWETTGKLRFS